MISVRSDPPSNLFPSKSDPLFIIKLTYKSLIYIVLTDLKLLTYIRYTVRYIVRYVCDAENDENK